MKDIPKSYLPSFDDYNDLIKGAVGYEEGYAYGQLGYKHSFEYFDMFLEVRAAQHQETKDKMIELGFSFGW